MLEVTIPETFAVTAVQDLGLPEESIIGTVLRGMDVIVPGGGDRVEGGDRLLICCTEAAVSGVRDLFAGG